MGIGVGIGIANFPFEDARGFWRWVDVCEAGGIDSIWQSDRLISKDSQLECMSVMAALAGGTKRIKFGMNVASLGLRDPVQTAKACATIDVLSEGRLLPAFGVGSARSKDFSATGTPTQGRGARSGEGLDIIRRLWSEDEVDFEGKYYTLHGASIAPKPIQSPLPLWVGGSADAAVDRTARFGTGWQAGIETAAEISPVIKAIKTRCTELGTHIAEDHFGAGFGFRFGSSEEPMIAKYNQRLEQLTGKPAGAYSAVGSADDMLTLLNEFHSVGVYKFILRPIAQGADEMIAQTKRLIEEFLPQVSALNSAAPQP